MIGSLLGFLLPLIPERIHHTLMQGLGIAILVLGAMMAFKSENFLIVIISVAAGGVIGELLGIERRLEQLGQWLERMTNRFVKRKEGTLDVAQGFVTATLVYCIGAMAILGAIEGGLKHEHDILYTKSLLDGISSIVFTSALGIGVIFSSVPVFLYQGIIALSATLITLFVTVDMLNAVIAEVTAVGGVLIIGIGLNLLEIKKIRVANLLPALLIAAAAVLVLQ